MQVSVVPETIVFSGELNELSSQEDIESAFKEVSQSTKAQRIKLDFSSVKRANSSGIVVLIRFLVNNPVKFEYIKCPVWLVQQFNMIDDFIGDNSIVSSFYAPYYCEQIDACRNICIEVPDELTPKENAKEIELGNKIIDGNEYEPDFDPSRYFQFLTKLVGRYK